MVEKNVRQTDANTVLIRHPVWVRSQKHTYNKTLRLVSSEQRTVSYPYTPHIFNNNINVKHIYILDTIITFLKMSFQKMKNDCDKKYSLRIIILYYI